MKISSTTQKTGLEDTGLCSLEDTNPKVISVKECKEYLGKFNLSDERIIEIRNYLIGVVDKSINSYLDDFR